MELPAAPILVLSLDRVERPIEGNEPIAEGSSPEPGTGSGFAFLCSKAAIKCPTAWAQESGHDVPRFESWPRIRSVRLAYL